MFAGERESNGDLNFEQGAKKITKLRAFPLSSQDLQYNTGYLANPFSPNDTHLPYIPTKTARTPHHGPSQFFPL